MGWRIGIDGVTTFGGVPPPNDTNDTNDTIGTNYMNDTIGTNPPITPVMICVGVK